MQRLIDALRLLKPRRKLININDAFTRTDKLRTSDFFDYAKMNTVEFAEETLGIKPFPYQAKLLQDESKRIVACMGRQSGKTTTIAWKAVKFALSTPKATILITSPSLRQSMIMFNRIQSLITNSPLRLRVTRATRTTIAFDNRSEIIALPASENQLRGYTAQMIICLPAHVKVTLANGEETPINQVKAGDIVLSFNERTKKIEPRKVLKSHCRPWQGKIVRLSHGRGYLECTPEHRVITSNGEHKAALLLSTRDKLLYLQAIKKTKHARRQSANSFSGTVSLRRTLRRFLSFEDNEDKGDKTKKQSPADTTLLKTSRICSLQIFNNEGFCQNSTSNRQKQRMGERIGKIFHSCLSNIYQGTPNLLQERKKNHFAKLAYKDNASNSLSDMVHGRWKPQPQFHNDHQYPCVSIRRTSDSSTVAGGTMGHSCQNGGRQTGKRVFPALSCEGQRQISGASPTIYHSQHDIQNFTEANPSDMPSLWAKIHPKKERLFHVLDIRKKTYMPKSKMQNYGTAKTSLQSISHALQNLWENFCSSHRKSSYLQQDLQSFIPFAAKTRVESCLQTKKEVKEVYNLTVKGNHNFFANRILVGNCDEASFMPDELITNIIFPMISVTQGYAVFLSTPWGRNHFFYKAFMNPAYSVHRVKSSENPNITSEFLEEMRLNMTEQAFKMEYEAEFVEDANSFFHQDLIRQCVVNDPPVELIESLEDNMIAANYYAGVDFGKQQDYSTVAIVRRENNIIQLAYLHEFPLGTAYTAVINHLVRAQQKFQLQAIAVDQTGVGEPVLDELKAQGFTNVQGLTFTVKTKEELLTTLKLAMEQKKLKLPYHRRLCQQINEQQYEYSRSGHLRFSHPETSHDDMLWALSMATYAATHEAPSTLRRAY